MRRRPLYLICLNGTAGNDALDAAAVPVLVFAVFRCGDAPGMGGIGGASAFGASSAADCAAVEGSTAELMCPRAP